MIQITDPLETVELVAFTRVVEAKSLSRAAAELRVPRATVGRRLARLEQRLGVRLLRRTTRSLALTDAGEAFYTHARRVLEAVEQAEACVRQSQNVMRGKLRVSAPPLGEETFLSMMIAFAKQYPDVRVQVDFTSRLVDLVREGYDVALRASGDLEPGLIARPIIRFKVIAVASPRYLAEHGTPRTAKDLRAHRCLTGFARGELPQAVWPVNRGVTHVESALSSNDPPLLLAAALEDLGIALLPALLVEDAIEQGRLVQVLPGVVEGNSTLAVVFPEREFLPPYVRAFADSVVEWGKVRHGPQERAARRPTRVRASSADASPRATPASGRRPDRASPARAGAARARS